MYYIYRHIRLDKNEVFYIGKGQYPKDRDNPYMRAYSKHRVNPHWKNIVKNTKYIIEIIFESSDENIIIEKEKEFIKLYGRKDLKLGTLVNFTDGGEGVSGRKNSEETKIKMSKSAKNRIIKFNQKEELINRMNKYRNTENKHSNKSVIQYDLKGSKIKEFSSLTEAAIQTKSNISKISLCVNGKRKSTKGFKWEFQI